MTRLLLGCWLVSVGASAAMGQEQRPARKVVDVQSVSSVTFEVYPSAQAVISREAAHDKLVSDVKGPGAKIDLAAIDQELQLGGNVTLFVRSDKTKTEAEDPRYWCEATFSRVTHPVGDGEQTISVYLHPKNKLQYLLDFPFYLPKTFGATCLIGVGLVVFGIRLRFDRLESKRRAEVLSAAGTEYERDFGQWLVVGKLGSGGMGEVLKAFPKGDIRREKMVAIKLRTGLEIENASPELLERDAEDRRRFQTETKVLATLNHHGIVKIYDWGIHEGKDYYVMDLVEGENLQSYLDRHPRPSLKEVKALFVQLLDVMIFAHEKGVLHRDLKPLNILRDRKGHLTVIDFGLARDQNQTVAFTQHGMPFIGSLEYMDPRVSLQMFQKITATPSDQGTDQFALGSILFLMLTGKMAIELPEQLGPQGLMPVLLAISEPRRSSLELKPNLPDSLHKVVATMLEVEVEKRYPDLRVAKEAFLRAIDPIT